MRKSSLLLMALCLSAGTWQGMAAETTPPAPVKATLAEGTIGKGRGVVTEKGENWVRIKSGETSERYALRWIGGMPKNGGGVDKEMKRVLAATPVGSQIDFEWLYSERLRITALRIVTTEAPASG